MGDDYPGLRSASTPGYPYFAPSGLKSRKKVGPSTSSGTGAPSVRSVSLPNWPLSSRKGKRYLNISLGSKSKGSNGGVAVGLPHRNSSVFKQAHINQRKVKGRIRMELRIREVDEGVGLRALSKSGGG